MATHPLLKGLCFEREVRVPHSGEELVFRKPTDCGDIAFSVLYPDWAEAKQVCSHAASVNGRSSAYPLECYGYAKAIAATLVTPAECEPLDIVSVLSIYDGDPLLWDLCCEKALVVLGLHNDQSKLCGLPAWEAVLRCAEKGDFASVTRLALAAIRALRPSASETEDSGDESPILESLAGKF